MNSVVLDCFHYPPSQIIVEILPFLYSTSDFTCAGNKLQSCFCFSPVLQPLLSHHFLVEVQFQYEIFFFQHVMYKISLSLAYILMSEQYAHLCKYVVPIKVHDKQFGAVLLVWLLPESTAPTPVVHKLQVESIAQWWNCCAKSSLHHSAPKPHFSECQMKLKS